MSRNKYLSFRTAEGVRKTFFKANVTVLLLIIRNNVTISRLYQIGSELADNFSLVDSTAKIRVAVISVKVKINQLLKQYQIKQIIVTRRSYHPVHSVQYRLICP